MDYQWIIINDASGSWVMSIDSELRMEINKDWAEWGMKWA